MIYAVVNYAPMDIDAQLAGFKRTFNTDTQADILYTFSQQQGKAKVTILFNSLEYCKKRTNVKILDNKNETLEEVIKKIKKAL